jgi:hypothetical protein
MEKIASIRKKQHISFGPTGAAKILFALMPNLFIAWDGAIRDANECDGSPSSYISFLKKVKVQIIQLEEYCKKAGFQLDQLPTKLGLGEKPILKMVDEHNWITQTMQFPIPEPAQLECVLQWRP